MAETDALSLLPARLLPWFAANARDLPWRADREPYHVWLSEIMLQQTRVEAVRGYYARFLAALPDLPALASCDPDALNKLWEGLGYYSRVRNLQAAAQKIMEVHGGQFPRTWAQVRALPGIGDYTAGAICSICFGLPAPAVDGNVVRVLTRLEADPRSFQDEGLRRSLRERLAAVYPKDRAGDFTQALMELGATVCVPNGAPACAVCPLADLCSAREGERWRDYPVRTAKKPRRVEAHTVFLLTCGDETALRQRPRRGLLAGLWELPNVPGHLEASEALSQAERWGLHPRELLWQKERTHIFTHVEWKLRCFALTCGTEAEGFTWGDPKQYALPTAFRMFL